MENRRRVERKTAFSLSRCHIEDEPSDPWRECAIFDVSTLGVGIDLCRPDAAELLSRRVTVLVELGPSFDITVAGEVRNAESVSDDIVRVGIEFVGLTETERAIVDILERRGVSVARRDGASYR